MCLQRSFKHFPQPLRSHIQSFGTIGQLLRFSTTKKLKMPPRGPGGGGFRIFWGANISFVVRKKNLWSFRTLTDLLLKFSKKSLKKPKNRPPGGQGVGVRILFFPQNFYYFFLGAHAKIWNPMTIPSVVLNSGGPNNKKRKKRLIT